jgi:hypothetical protein
VSTECECAVLAVRPKGLPPAGLADLLRRIGRVASRVDAFRTEVIAEAERTGTARQEGYVSTTAWLAAVSGEPAPICRSQIAVAASLTEMPETKKAFASGEVSVSRVRLLAEAQALAPEQFTQDEAALVAQAATVPFKQFPHVLAAWKRHTDPEAAEAEVERLHAQRALHLSPTWSGMVHVSGNLAPEGGLQVLAAIQALAEPAALDPSDTRTPAQRQADALVEICRRHQMGDGKPSRRTPQVLVTIPWSTLQSGKGIVDTEAGPITGHTVRRLTCDCTVSRVLLDSDSVPIEMGRATRLVPDSLRRLLELRDRGCTYPGCDRPARWCEAHHKQHWADGGTTDLANLQLLCTAHHTTTHGSWYPRRQ